MDDFGEREKFRTETQIGVFRRVRVDRKAHAPLLESEFNHPSRFRESFAFADEQHVASLQGPRISAICSVSV
jgi:hypothetical protein